MLHIKQDNYSITLNEESGRLYGLFDNLAPDANWVAALPDKEFAAPFIQGSQTSEKFLSMHRVAKVIEGDRIFPCCQPHLFGDHVEYDYPHDELEPYPSAYAFASKSGRTSIEYTFHDDHFVIDAQIPSECGPRAGVELDFHFLDVPTGVHWTEQVAINTTYTDPGYEYAYFILQRPGSGYLALAVDSPFAAWRLKYSNEGHLITGMQILSLAEDLAIYDDRKIRKTDNLRLKFAFCETIDECYSTICRLLGIGIASYSISGGPRGGQIALKMIGGGEQTRIVRPDGREWGFVWRQGKGLLDLHAMGEYAIVVRSSNGREHISRVLCHDEWRQQFDKVNHFYRHYFQLESGAFARVIWSETRSPLNGRTFAGEAFGDSREHVSCRTGEFGGFAGWAMLKNLQLFGPQPWLKQAVDHYLRDWALNEKDPEHPYFGSSTKQPSSMLGMHYSPYHLYEEWNYPQYETWLMAQLRDYYLLTQDKGILDHLIGLGTHYLNDHIDPYTGTVISQNSSDEKGVDYSTVDAPVTHLGRVGKLLQSLNHPASEVFLNGAKCMAEHLVSRGLDFPTEGEPCTEDGSMACTALSLLYAYQELELGEEALSNAGQLLKFHNALEMKGFDCRMRGSSVRFWETLYETRDWGASLSAGHCWSLWTGEAKLLMYQQTHKLRWLLEAYEAFIANMCTVDQNGGIHCCYTPDMIPGTPHMPYSRDAEEEPDLYVTSTPLAAGYPTKTYSASGNYYLIKAAEYWTHMSGLIVEDGTTINARWDDDGQLESLGAHFEHLGLTGLPVEPLRVKVAPGTRFTITFEHLEREPEISGGEIVSQQDNVYIIQTRHPVVTIG